MPQRKNQKQDMIAHKIMRHVQIKQQVDKLNAERATITEDLKKSLPKIGIKDSMGSFVYTEVVGDRTVTAKNTKKVSTSPVPEIEEILLADKQGKKYVKKQTIDVFDSERLQADIIAGKVNAELVKRLYEVNISFALTTSIK